MSLVRFGFHFSSTTYPDVDSAGIFDRICAVAQAAEASGFDSVWVPDHFHQNPIGGGPSGPMLEAYTLLGAIAARTERVLLGTLVSPVTFRPPALLAKVVTALDVVSHGRAVLGIGAGWDVAEHAAYDVYFPGVKEREDRLEEATAMCIELFASSPVSTSGPFTTLVDAWNAPRPVQARIPVLVGGGGEKRTLRIAAKYADVTNFFGEPSVVTHKLEVLQAHCSAVGRDFSELSTTAALMAAGSVQEVVDAVGERLSAGVDGVVLFGREAPGPDVVASYGEALRTAFA